MENYKKRMLQWSKVQQCQCNKYNKKLTVGEKLTTTWNNQKLGALLQWKTQYELENLREGSEEMKQSRKWLSKWLIGTTLRAFSIVNSLKLVLSQEVSSNET